jgi:hypothetical protein
MSTYDAMPRRNQFSSDSGLERGLSLEGEAIGNRIDDFGTVESTSSAQIPHHDSCCCLSCWQKNMHVFLYRA